MLCGIAFAHSFIGYVLEFVDISTMKNDLLLVAVPVIQSPNPMCPTSQSNESLPNE